VDQVVVEAKADALGPYATGATSASIHGNVSTVAGTVIGTVRAGTWYSSMIQHGTRPHIIRPRNYGGKLVFYWRKTGQVEHFDYVRHPGMKPKRFLTDPAERVGRRHRFIVFTYD